VVAFAVLVVVVVVDDDDDDKDDCGTVGMYFGFDYNDCYHVDAAVAVEVEHHRAVDV
jgi:hypothetical protein